MRSGTLKVKDLLRSNPAVYDNLKRSTLIFYTFNRTNEVKDLISQNQQFIMIISTGQIKYSSTFNLTNVVRDIEGQRPDVNPAVYYDNLKRSKLVFYTCNLTKEVRDLEGQ